MNHSIALPRPALNICVGLVLGMSAFVFPDTALGCSCAQAGTVCDEVGRGRAVFVGRVVSIEPLEPTWLPFSAAEEPGALSTPEKRYTFQVGETFSGKFGSNVVTVTAEVPIDGRCGVSFELGKDYLVSGGQRRGEIGVSQCSLILLFEDAANELALLRESKRGSVKPRLWGTVYDQRSRLDGRAGLDWKLVAGIGGVRVTAKGKTGTFVAQSDSQGRFAFTGLPLGDYRVELDLTGKRTLEEYARDMVTVKKCSGEISFFTSVVSLFGTVRSADGSPLPERIPIWVTPASVFPPSADEGTFDWTDADGAWEIKGLPPGQYRLAVNVFPSRYRKESVAERWYPAAALPSEATVVDVSDERPVELAIELLRSGVR